MPSSKMLLTYKRKRLSTKHHEYETCNLPKDTTNDHPLTNIVQQDGSSDKHSSESLRLKSGASHRCIKCNDKDGLVHCDDCGQFYHRQCLDPFAEATHQEKNLCLICVRQQDSSACFPEKDPGKDLGGSGSRQRTEKPHNVNLSSPEEGASKGDTLTVEMCSVNTSKCMKVDSCNNGDGVCFSDVEVSDLRLTHTLMGMNNEGSSVFSSLKTSELKSSFCDDSSSILETSELKEKYPPLKCNMKRPSETSSEQANRNSAMITFSRRHKREKNVNVSLGSKTGKINERLSQEGCSVDVISESKVSADDSNGQHEICQNLDDAKLMFPVEACGESASEAITSSFGNPNTSKSVSYIVRPEAVSSCLEALKGHEKLPSTNYESSSNDVVKVSSSVATGNSELEAYRDRSSVVSSADDEATRSRILKAAALPDTHGTKNNSIGLNLNLPVPTTDIPGSSSSELQTSIRILEDSQLVCSTDVSGIISTSAEECITSIKSTSLVSMPDTLKKSCLQLFSDNLNGSCSPAKTVVDCMGSQERETLQLRTGNDHAVVSRSPVSLGLSLSTGPKNVGYVLPNSSSLSSLLSPPPREFTHDPVLLSSFNQPSSRRHKLMLDSITNRARGISARGSFQEKIGLCSAVWPEEELDCLWVGVRRHGKGNWDAMLRDSSLQFAPWRVSRDLAERWEEEQTKLFSGTIFSQDSHSKGQLHIPNHNYGLWPSNIRPRRKESLIDNTSVGDVYADQRSHVPRRPCLNPGNCQNEAEQLHGPLSYQMRTFQSGHQAGRLYGESFIDPESRFFTHDGPLSVKYPLPSLAESGRLPHWLREVVSTPVPRVETSFAPKISSVPHSGTLRVDHSYSDPSDPCSAGVIRSRVSDLRLLDAGSRYTSAASMRPKSARRRRHSFLVSKPERDRGDNVIIIDSDASSEETISDNCSKE